jgi:hypothetical protein
MSLALLHGVAPVASLEAEVAARLDNGLTGLRARFPDTPDWLVRTERALAQPFFTSSRPGTQRSATILAWLAPLASYRD